MLILGDISGIQDFLFDVREPGGKQAAMLRFRSLRLQLVVEAIARRVLPAMQLTKQFSIPTLLRASLTIELSATNKTSHSAFRTRGLCDPMLMRGLAAPTSSMKSLLISPAAQSLCPRRSPGRTSLVVPLCLRRRSVETMTSVALMTATAGLPFFSLRRFAEDVLMSETIWCPPPMSMVTSLITEPLRIETTVPAN